MDSLNKLGPPPRIRQRSSFAQWRHPPQVAIRLQYHGEKMHAESVTIVTDGEKWQSPYLAFSRQQIDRGEYVEVTHLGLEDPAIFSLATKIAQAERVIVRFRGRFHADLVVSKDMKADLRAVLAALAKLGIETEYL